MSTENHWNSVYRQDKAPWQGVPTWLKQQVGKLDVDPKVALDLGCGTGEKSRWLAELGYSVTGIDVSAEAISKASERSKASTTFIVGDIADLELLNIPNPPYGLILDLLTAQFLDAQSQKNLFDHLKAMLSNSGALIHSRLEANSDEAPQWVQKLAVSPQVFEASLKDLEVTWHETRKSKNLPATTAHQYVIRPT